MFDRRTKTRLWGLIFAVVLVALTISGCGEKGSPTAEATATLEPSHTPIPTPLPEPTSTPPPTNTPLPTSTPEPTPTPITSYIVAGADGANVRSGPDTNHARMGYLDPGAEAEVTGYHSDWWQIEYNGALCWVFGGIVSAFNTDDVPQVEPPPAPTAAPPTATSPPAATAILAQPTDAPQPTEPPTPAGPDIRIVTVDKRAEFVDIHNYGDQPQDLGGWVLVSEKGDQACTLGGVVNPGETLRIWALAADAGQGGYNCGFGSNIWNNSESDPAALYDAAGQLVDRYP